MLLATLLVAAAAPFFAVSPEGASRPVPFPGWMSHWQGEPLQRMPLSDCEARFANGFPGKIARFTDGERQYVIRWVHRKTRQLHPAVDCFRGSGYSIRPAPVRIDTVGERWGCFEAARSGEALDVCERIFDDAGNSWSDVSAWYWAAALGRSDGPWWAITRVSARSSEAQEGPPGTQSRRRLLPHVAHVARPAVSVLVPTPGFISPR